MAESIKSFLPVIEKSLRKLVSWHKEYGDAGYDPYDIRSYNSFLRKISSGGNNVWERVAGMAIFDLLDQYFPLGMRKVFGIKKKIHPTAMGLFFASYLNLDQLFPGKGYDDKEGHYRKWLISNRLSGYDEYCWGLPFDWGAYPEGTPYAVVNAWVGDAFFRSYKIHGREEDIEICKSICRFFLQHLHRSPGNKGGICFSYSPVKADYINNANLFVAEFLIRVGYVTDNATYIETGKQAAEYTLNHQLKNGLIPYFGEEEDGKKAKGNDLYHSGYELRMLLEIGRHTGDARYSRAAGKYWDYISSNHLIKGYIPKTKTTKGYTDITSCAEIILVFNNLLKIKGYEKFLLHFLSGLQWIIHHFQSDEGYFYYKLRKTGYVTRIPYIRWGQAWMLLALTDSFILLKSLTENEDRATG